LSGIVYFRFISGLSQVYPKKSESLPGIVYLRFISGLSQVYLRFIWKNVKTSQEWFISGLS
jgi:hypothetical protein